MHSNSSILTAPSNPRDANPFRLRNFGACEIYHGADMLLGNQIKQRSTSSNPSICIGGDSLSKKIKRKCKSEEIIKRKSSTLRSMTIRNYSKRNRTFDLTINSLSQHPPLIYKIVLMDHSAQTRRAWQQTGQRPLDVSTLVSLLRTQLVGRCVVQETLCGAIVECSHRVDAEHITALPLAKYFHGNIILWRSHKRPRFFWQSQRMRSHRKPRFVHALNVPASMPPLQIQNALRLQGVLPGCVSRVSSGRFRIEVRRPGDLGRLQRDGINFFDVTTFPVVVADNSGKDTLSMLTGDAVLESRASTESNCSSSSDEGGDCEYDNDEAQWLRCQQLFVHDDGAMTHCPVIALQHLVAPTTAPLQCYNCQRFWHRAAQCPYRTRCMHCGQSHNYVDCDASEPNAAMCILCQGDHEATSPECPLRKVHAHSVRVSFAMSRSTCRSLSWNPVVDFFIDNR